MVESTEQQIDTNLHSRAIGTMGIETIGKLMKLNVLIVGQRGLGVEVAKNLCLAGPRSVTLYDPTTVSIGDLSANFFLSEEDVDKKTRAEATMDQLKELNPYVDVTLAKDVKDEDVAKYSVICVTENLFPITRLIEINKKARAEKVGFILSETLGAMVYAFVDYGSHTIFDADGEQTKPFIISSITQEEKPTVTVHEDKRHTFADGDYVVFREVEGMTELNGHEPV
jgi:ubiquitin-activating enzyme E1